MSCPIAEFWPAFQECMETANAFRRRGALRCYQETILERGSFDVVSPFTGKVLPVSYSTKIGPRIAYAFECIERFWLLAEDFRFGHPLSTFVREHTAECRRILGAGDSLDPARATFVLNRLRDTRPRGGASHDMAHPLLIIGHPNFAHHLWNELSALDEWLSRTSDETIRRLKVLPTAEPLGPLRDIFPRLKLATFVTRYDRTDAGSPQPMLVRVGSRLVTNRVRKSVSAFSEKQVELPKLDALRRILGDDNWPRIWISVRLNSRTAENQDEFLLAVLRRIFQTYPEAAVVFDGFSYPVGFYEDSRMDSFRADFVQRADDTGRAIETLMQRAASELGQEIGSRLCSISGCSLPEAIYLGSYCNYYICHAGTLQHKIAWFHNIPGFIHSPSHGKAPKTWYASQVEDGISPDSLPARYLREIGPSPNKRNVSRNQNYEIIDLENSADLVIQSMQTHLVDVTGGQI